MTLNQTIRKLNDFADAHQQLNHFFFGEEWDFAASGVVNAPVMISVLQPETIFGNTLTRSFKIFFGDLVHKDLSNKAEVLSDMEQVAMDFVYQMQHPDYEWVFDTSNLVLNDFEDSFDCELYGFWVFAKFKSPSAFDRCAIPMLPIQEGLPGCAPVTIYNSDGSIRTVVSSGGSYTLDPATCPDAFISNSNGSYTSIVSSGGSLILPDEMIEVYVNGSLNTTVNYVTLGGNRILITVPMFQEIAITSGSVDGNNDTFDLAHDPSQVFYNGALQILDTDYRYNAPTLQFLFVPFAGESIRFFGNY